MKHLLFSLLLISLVACGSGGSKSPTQTLSDKPSVPHVTGEKNIELNNTYILNGTTFIDDDFVNQEIIISITNHSNTESLYFDIVLSDNGSDWLTRTGTLGPEETRDIRQDLYTWLGGNPGSHVLEISIDFDNIVDETDETDNSIEQTIYILPTVIGVN